MMSKLLQLKAARSLTWFSAFIVTLALWSATGNGAEKVTIGAVETVILLLWDVKVPARIDTGAATSSLGANGLKIRDNFAEFKLREKYGGLKLKIPIYDWRYIRSAEGRTKRPVVLIDICLGPKYIRTEVTRKDRSRLKYPFLVGRKVLKGNFVVDVSQRKTARPDCPELRFQ